MRMFLSKEKLTDSINADYCRDLFKTLSLRYQLLASEAGVDLIPFFDESLPLFSQQTKRRKKEILNALETSVKICVNMGAEGHRMDNIPMLVWQALKELRLRPPSDLFSHIYDCTVIEIYAKDNIQLFRSFSFFKYCSYSLEELYCRPWPVLFPRDDLNIIPMIFKFVEGVFSGVIKNTVSLRHIPKHILREAFSSRRFVLEVGMNWGAPLFHQGSSEPAATIFLETGTLMGKDMTNPIPVRPAPNDNAQLLAF
jgi:hypothetical protein